MTSTEITAMRVVVLHPFMDVLLAHNCSELDAASALSIDVFDLRSADTLVAATKIYAFLNWAAQRVGDPMLGARQGVLMAAGGWAPIVPFLEESPNLVSVLTRFCIAAGAGGGASVYRLNVDSNIAAFEMTRPSIDTPDTSQVDAVAVGVFVELVRRCANDAWLHKDVVATTSEPDCIPEDVLPPSSVLRGSSGVSLRFPSGWLNNTMPPISHAPAISAPLYPATAPLSIIQLVRRILTRNLADAQYCLEDAAEELSLSKLKLQAGLKASGESFTSLRRSIQRELGVERVGSSSVPISLIALELGYQSESNFSRAFRNWTGRSPTEYRKTQSEKKHGDPAG
ncbi:MAG: helix-turn-helix domain-containing protein [Hyphomicrobiaceae bacterium]